MSALGRFSGFSAASIQGIAFVYRVGIGPLLVAHMFHVAYLGTVQVLRLAHAQRHGVGNVHDDVDDACHNFTLCVPYMMTWQGHVGMIMRPTFYPTHNTSTHPCGA